MKTENLIQAMAADTTPTRPVERSLALALAATVALAGLAFYLGMGIRPDFLGAIGDVRVVAKHAFPILLAVTALGAVIRLARPGATTGGWARALLMAPALALVAFVTAMASTPAAAWGGMIVTPNLAICLIMIPLIGLPILGASLLALRDGASTAPGLTGAAAGLLSGSVAASIYAFYCIEDSPLFWALWYPTAIAVVTLAGFATGRRLLRW